MPPPLPLEALKFETSLSTERSGEHEYQVLKLRYYVETAGLQTDLVRIRLNDTLPSSPADRLRFWFYYRPILIPWSTDQRADETEFVTTRFPSIDLIVFSSVRVTIDRQTAAIDRFQSIAFKELEIDNRNLNATFSPVRPKISLRRVHREIQIPLLGSPFHLQGVQPSFSFYVDDADRPHYTFHPHLAALMAAAGPFTEADRLAAKHSWTRVSFDQDGTAFDFPESTFSLRVLDQHYDSIDTNRVPEEMEFGDAVSKQDTAAQLVSLPKSVRYDVALDPRPQQMANPRGGAYIVRGRTAVTIAKSSNVHLAGTISQDERTNAFQDRLISEVNDYASQMTHGANYRDYLPSILLRDEHNKPLALESLERAAPAPANYEFTKSGSQQFFEFEVSMIIGFTPIAGEAFGLYELYTAWNYDEDAFGNKLKGWDWYLVVVAGILPFVGFAGLKRGVRFLSKDVFPLLNQTLVDAREAVSRLGSL